VIEPYNNYDESSDIYSLGIVFYEIFFRTLPFTDASHLLITTVSPLPPDIATKEVEALVAQGWEVDLTNSQISKSEFNVMVAKQEICRAGLRPAIPKDYQGPLVAILKSCWAHAPKSRPTCEGVESFLLAYKLDSDTHGSVLNLTGMRERSFCIVVIVIVVLLLFLFLLLY
jgi:serine/threonine protein kinase